VLALNPSPDCIEAIVVESFASERAIEEIPGLAAALLFVVVSGGLFMLCTLTPYPGIPIVGRLAGALSLRSKGERHRRPSLNTILIGLGDS
jgi:hypothetical protein